MKRINTLVASAAIAVASATAASAITVTFGSGPDNQSTVDFGDFTVTATAIGLSPTVDQGNGGLGVNGGPLDETGQLDNFPIAERLTFNFDSTVTLTEVDFRGLGSNEEYTLFVDGVNQGVFSNDPLVRNEVLTSFAIQATRDSFFEPLERFRIKSITYDLVSEVPLPAAGWMLLAGLGGMAAMRRKK